MTAQEQMELNQNLTALGVPPLAISAIPISVVYADNIPDDSMKEPIQILSDSEEGVLANPEQTTMTDITPDVPLTAIKLPSASTVHSGDVASKTTYWFIFAQNIV